MKFNCLVSDAEICFGGWRVAKRVSMRARLVLRLRRVRENATMPPDKREDEEEDEEEGSVIWMITTHVSGSSGTI